MLSNHTHTVLYVSREEALAWTDQEVIERWYKRYGGNVLVNRFINGEAKTAAEHKAATQQIEIWRTRLLQGKGEKPTQSTFRSPDKELPVHMFVVGRIRGK